MAILALAANRADLKQRLSRILVAQGYDDKPITADDLGATGAMAVLLKDAIKPNLVQTTENTPALIHAGPFANIAHGTASIISINAALRLSRVRGGRGRVRLRPRRGEVRRHRRAAGGLEHRGLRARGHGARAQAPGRGQGREARAR